MGKRKWDEIRGSEVDLVLIKKTPEDVQKGYVPAYHFRIISRKSMQEAGFISIRIGNNENTFYGGHIGYEIKKEFRGNRYAAKACLLIKKVAEYYRMEKLFITCNPDNMASRKTCEIIGAELKKILDLPSHNEMYKEGERQKCLYEWRLQ